MRLRKIEISRRNVISEDNKVDAESADLLFGITMLCSCSRLKKSPNDPLLKANTSSASIVGGTNI